MKRVWLCIGIVAAMLLAGISAFIFINATSNSLIGKVQLVEKAFSEEKYELALSTAEEAEQEWNRFVGLSVLVTDQEHALEISTCFVKIKVLARERDEELFSECEIVKNLVTLFRNEQKPSIKNIL